MEAQKTAITAILVHAAWFDGSSWAKVIRELADLGIDSAAAQLPLTSLSDDAAAVRAVIDRQPGPVVLVGHSYGGAAVTAAGVNSNKVKALIFVAAIVPDEGETVGAVFQRAPAHPLAPRLEPDGAGLLWVDKRAFTQAIAPDASPAEAALLAAVQKPISLECLSEPMGKPAWRARPTYFLVAENDRMLAAETQRFLAARMNSRTVSLPLDHTPLLSAPHAIVNLVAEAVQAAGGV